MRLTVRWLDETTTDRGEMRPADDDNDEYVVAVREDGDGRIEALQFHACT
jgi:hypothetical protein